MDRNFGFARLTRIGAATMSLSLPGVAGALAEELYSPGEDGPFGAPQHAAASPPLAAEAEGALPLRARPRVGARRWVCEGRRFASPCRGG